MIGFLIGVVLTAILYTFYPDLAIKASAQLRRLKGWIDDRSRMDGGN